jgi:hypothetical protein
MSETVELFKEIFKKLLLKQPYYTVGRIFLVYNKLILITWIYFK